MFRGTTARTVFSLPAATPLAVQIFAPAATFATAHTLSHAKAKTPSGAIPTPAVAAARRDRSPGTYRTRSSAALQVLCR
ncbi:hypothetical protein [Streptomyces sp. NPDC093970]|uniref:hypothetical protein n=1 Tax=Streptomyces sp. NPDC093970 TaxID=3155076 RepID=UPI003447AE41